MEGNIIKRQQNTGDETATTLETRKIHVLMIKKDYVLFERNIAVFYFNAVRKLWKWYNKEQSGIQE